ncbi:MAG TPA: 4Fe-4S binding protein [Fervidobacterium sp.]|nr:ferredoxin [Fervidobacterium sp.]HOQ39260.1 4Fe-4S binding protein [Fervidobacterium sp.]HPT53849.1 4Fe-4S binding protein [Fervidobacterium sp.]HPZ17147.1 4Fe-4S binding protein [Fervidobacterium sp.]HQE48162.1 4Fe-4S binding protein [Fervidobacterium sp.]
MARKQYRVEIKYEWCKSCGICYHVCPTKTIINKELGKPVVLDHSKCIGCLVCENLCPDFAINIVEMKQETDTKSDDKKAKVGVENA